MKMTAFWDTERYSLVVVLKKARATSERHTYLWNVGLLRDFPEICRLHNYRRENLKCYIENASNEGCNLLV
jgi:hypothetical protein